MSSAAENSRVPRSVLVTGATGVVGHYLLPRLCKAGFSVQAISRRRVESETMPAVHPEGDQGRVRWLSLDLAHGWPVSSRPASSSTLDRSTLEPNLEPIAILLHAAPIWLLPRLLPVLSELGLRRLVAFSSTSRFTKRDSSSARERDTARRLADAEEAVESICRERGIAWTIFRPTLIYGGGRDRNVSAIAGLVRRFGVVPVAGPALGARQPVHADDLARACLAALDNPTTFAKAYNLPGGETLTYTEMVTRIAHNAGRKPQLMYLPPRALRFAIGLARLLPGLAYLSPSMVDRMNEDLAFSAEAARRDFGYAPRRFMVPEEPLEP